MSVTVKNPVIAKKIAAARKPPINQCLNAIASDNASSASSHGWTRFKVKQAIETQLDTDHSGRVFVNDAVAPGRMQKSGLSMAMNQSVATNKQIGGWLQFGTSAHGPKTAKMLSWIQGGKRVFARSVKGITATDWWGLKDSAKKKVRDILQKYYSKKM